MASNNPHIQSASSRAVMLQPGQVVVIAKTKSENNTKLQKMKKEAAHAHRNKSKFSSPVIIN